MLVTLLKMTFTYTVQLCHVCNSNLSDPWFSLVYKIHFRLGFGWWTFL